jgi:hypothetical protein
MGPFDPILSTAQAPSTGYSAMFEDDGKVAYAYLLRDGRIIADVWLYNRAPTPEEPEWQDREKAPFLNPRRYVREEAIEPAHAASDVGFEWNLAAGELDSLRIFLHQRPVGLLKPGAKPGWAYLASEDGPLAKVWRPS